MTEVAAKLPPVVSLKSFLWEITRHPCNAHIEKYGLFGDCGGTLSLVVKQCVYLTGGFSRIVIQCQTCKILTSRDVQANVEQIDHVEREDEENLLFPRINGFQPRYQRWKVQTVLCTLLAGCTYQQQAKCNSWRAKSVSKSYFYEIQRFLCDAISNMAYKYFAGFRFKLRDELMVKKIKRWLAQMDGAWAHRGWKSRHHTFLIRDIEGNKVVCCVVLFKRHMLKDRVVQPGNYEGTSKGMESEAFKIALKELDDSGLLKYLEMVVSDGDSSVPQILRMFPGSSHVRNAGDPGHRGKNLMRSMAKIFGSQGKYKSYPWRIGKFFMRCVKEAEHAFDQALDAETLMKRKLYFSRKFKYIYAHYTQEICPKQCPCNEFYQGDDKSEFSLTADLIREVLFHDPINSIQAADDKNDAQMKGNEDKEGSNNDKHDADVIM